MGCAGVAITLESLCRQVERLTKLIVPTPARCIVALLTMVLPSPLLLSIGREDDACSTNVDRSPTALAHAVFWALKA
jgi:hypothetical protein